MTTSVDVSDAMLDSVNDVRDILRRTECDHRVYIEPPAEWDQLQDGLYVTGYRRAGLDKCAFVHANGGIEWLR